MQIYTFCFGSGNTKCRLLHSTKTAANLSRRRYARRFTNNSREYNQWLDEHPLVTTSLRYKSEYINYMQALEGEGKMTIGDRIRYAEEI